MLLGENLLWEKEVLPKDRYWKLWTRINGCENVQAKEYAADQEVSRVNTLFYDTDDFVDEMSLRMRADEWLEPEKIVILFTLVKINKKWSSTKSKFNQEYFMHYNETCTWIGK